MSWLKKFWIIFVSFLPLTSAAVAPLVIGGIAGATVIAGFSIYRSSVPVDMSSALDFFSSCWSCGMFSSIMATMSGILPGVYHAIGRVVIPMVIALTAVWFAWRLVSGFMNSGTTDGIKTAGGFGAHTIKLIVVISMLMMPLPRMLNDIAIRPIFSVGLSVSRIMDRDDSFAQCLVATAVADPASISADSANKGAYSPAMRHELSCEVANIHQMTGLGMAVGWTMLNMAFDQQYMHKLMWQIPFFPNVPLFFVGLLILALFFAALLPVPMYFLEIFIKLSMDLIMLPLMLMSWLFDGWILPKGKKSIQTIIDDVVSGTLGIAVTGVFVTFAVMFLNAAFGNWQGGNALRIAIENNDSKILMDALMMNNDSLVTVILMGVFIAMFMTMIPALSKTLFNIDSVKSMNEGFYKTAKNNLDTLWKGMKKIYEGIKK